MVFVAGVFDARWFETHAYWMMALLLAAVASGLLLMWDDLRDCGKSILLVRARKNPAFKKFDMSALWNIRDISGHPLHGILDFFRSLLKRSARA
jgi:uncharacterized iron-regulated membrane protein